MLEQQTGGKNDQINSLNTSYGLKQIISDPTHILPNSSSRTDLIFTNQLNLATESEVHPSLHFKYHHQIIFAKLNLKVYSILFCTSV